MNGEMRMVALDLLNEPPYPMRAQLGEIPFSELCDSIRAKGILEPLIVRPVNGRYDVVAGHRRYKAARVVALAEVPCIVREMTEREAVEVMIHENTGREEVTAASEGWFYLELVDRFKLSERELCDLVKKSLPYINERIDLVRGDHEIAEAVDAGKINFSVARELLRVNKYTAALIHRCDAAVYTEEQVEKMRQHRLFLLDLCVKSGATARVARSYVEQWKAGLVPTQPFAPVATASDVPPPAAARMPRCLVCGRDGDPQNMLDLKVHYWEKDGVLKILRSAGIEVYE